MPQVSLQLDLWRWSLGVCLFARPPKVSECDHAVLGMRDVDHLIKQSAGVSVNQASVDTPAWQDFMIGQFPFSNDTASQAEVGFCWVALQSVHETHLGPVGPFTANFLP